MNEQKIINMFLIGGSGTDPKKRNIGDGWLLPKGWKYFVTKFVQPLLARGVTRFELHNPGGTLLGEDMQADQFLIADKAGLKYLTADFVAAWAPITAKGIEVICYVGNPKTTAPNKILDLMACFDLPLKAGMSIGMDATSFDVNDPYFHFIKLLQGLGTKVYVEPWPNKTNLNMLDVPTLTTSQFLPLCLADTTWAAKKVDIRAETIVLLNEPPAGETWTTGSAWIAKWTRGMLDQGFSVLFGYDLLMGTNMSLADWMRTKVYAPIVLPPPPPPPTVLGAYLTPGEGFGAPLLNFQTGVVGTPGQEAKAIARWNTVQNQVVKDEITVSVIGFHISGKDSTGVLDRVSFSANNGDWQEMKDMTFNPDTGTVEYFARIKASDFPDGPVEVRAIAIPKSGQTRTLQDLEGADEGCKSLHLYTNAHGTLPEHKLYVTTTGLDTNPGTEGAPLATILGALKLLKTQFGDNAIDNATIVLGAGEFSYPDTGIQGQEAIYGADRYWLTIDGQNVATIIGPRAAAMQKYIHLKNLKIKVTDFNAVLTERSNQFGNHFWLDNVDCDGPGMLYQCPAGQRVQGPIAGDGATPVTYLTNVRISEGLYGYGPAAIMARNVKGLNIGGDWSNSDKLTVNCSVKHMRVNNPLVHPDVLQVPIGPIENLIIYGLTALDFNAQGITLTGRPMKNVAVINTFLKQMLNDPQYTGIGGGGVDHVLYLNNTWLEISNYFGYPKGDGTYGDFTGDKNVLVKGNIFQAASPASNIPAQNIIIDGNHFIDTSSYGVGVAGTNYTTGPITVVEPVV